MRPRSPLWMVWTMLALAMVVTGCSQATPGQASPGTRVTTTASMPTTATGTARPTRTSRATANGPLAGTSPCELVSDADRTRLGLGRASEEGTEAYARYCQFTAVEFTAAVNIYDELGPDKQADGAKGRKPVPTVGRHDAQQWIHAGGTCVVSIATSTTSTVDATVTDIDGNDQRSCDAAMKLAQVVEPKLP
jgi:hypothetical protein